MNKTLEKILSLASVVIFTSVLLATGYKIGEWQTRKKIQQEKLLKPAAERNIIKDKQDLDFSLFWEAWDTVEELYIDKEKIDPQKMYYGAIKGMVAALGDPYTFFLTPEENKESKKDLEGKFEGIGAQLGLKNNLIVVIAPLKNSPAEKAGLKAGDIILAVDGQSTEGWTLLKAVQNIRGKKGTPVELTILRGKTEKKIKIIRDEINIPSIELSFEKPQDFDISNTQRFAYLKLYQFGTNTNKEWDKAVEQIQSRWSNREIKGLILDLRNNPGGYLNSSVYIAEEFLEKGRLIVKQEFVDKDPRSFTVRRKGRLLDIPLIVLINKGSASASEILAGALQDHKRALIIGEKSFGKGSVQKAVDLSGEAGIHVTVSKWVLPNGAWINGTGITPDIQVKIQIEEGNTITKQTDTQLKRAVEELFKN